MKCSPGISVDFSLQCGLQRLIGIVCTEKIGVAHEEALFVVVGVDEPAGDPIRSVGADFAGLRMKDIHAVDLDLDLIVLHVENLNIRFTEDNEQVALPGILQLAGHMQIGVHARLENGDAAEFVEL